MKPLLTSILLLMALTLSAQVKVTPVESDDKAPQKPTLHYYDRHGKPLEEPVYILADLDTVAKPKSGPNQPLYCGVDVEANVFDAVMLLFGREYADYGLQARASLHNWFFPAIEAGIGTASRFHPDQNFRYKAVPSPYFKIGLDYNFLYKSNPAYQVFIGMRACYSSFRYHITDINIQSGYWQENSRPQIPRQSASAFYGQALAGIQVKLYKNFHMGWTVRWNIPIHTNHGHQSKPWYIPGYGANNPITFTYSLIFTIPGSKPAADTQ